jgi:hypothetical protein
VPSSALVVQQASLKIESEAAPFLRPDPANLFLQLLNLLVEIKINGICPTYAILCFLPFNIAHQFFLELLVFGLKFNFDICALFF